MIYKSLLVLVIGIFIVTGCSIGTTEVEVKKLDEFHNAPTWVKTKQINKMISEIGVQAQTTLTFTQQRDKAIENAKTNLAKKLNIKISNIFTLLQDTTIDEKLYLNRTKELTKKLLQTAINDAKVMKLWQNDYKTIYVLVATDIDKLKTNFTLILQNNFKDMPNIKSNYTLELERGNIDQELSR